MKNKILLCCFPGDFSGVPIYSRCVVNELSDEFGFTVLTSTKGSVFEGVSSDIVEDQRLKNSLMPNKILNNFMILYGVVRSVKPDVVHLNGTMFGLVGRLLSLFVKTKFVFTYHGLPWGQGRNIVFSTIMLAMEMFLLNFIRIPVVAISKMDYRRLKRVSLTNRFITYIPNSVEKLVLDLKYPNFRNDLKRDITIVNIARFSPQKNILRLFEAFVGLPDNFKLTLVGTNTDSIECQDLALSICGREKLGRIEFKGVTDDVSQALANATVFCLSSNYEGMPLSAIEAMSVGIPIILPNVGGSEEFFECGAACIYKPNTSAALRSALIDVCNDYERLVSMSQAGRAGYLDIFSLKKFRENHHSFYLSVLKS